MAHSSVPVPAASLRIEDGHVNVTVRVRPENVKEIEGNFRNIVQVLDEQVLVFDPKVDSSPGFFHGRKRRNRDIMKRKNRDLKFMFDCVFGPEVTNSTVYSKTTQAVLDGLLNGYNCSVFAYGATGAGKTHTMLGSKDNPGITFLTMMELYERIENMKHETSCDVAVSYLEVYNEQIHDLLMPSGNLPIREDPQKGVIVAGLSLHKPGTAEELLHMLEFGNKNRTQHPTDANAESSRSHAVFQVFIRQKEKTANISADVRLAKMLLVDLAGSERATVTTNRGMRFREGANINKSLLALGNCISALASGKAKKHVPYRNSKLTRLLKDSLGGNCRTVMIAAVSPSAMSFEDTYNTLQYASRAKNIKTNLKRNVVNVDFHVSQYGKIVKELRQEIVDLKNKLLVYEQGQCVAQTSIVPVSATDNDKLQCILGDVFQQRIAIRKELLELDSSYKIVTYKISRKERLISRINTIQGEILTRAQKTAVSQLKQWVTSSEKNKANMETRRLSVENRMAENQEWMTRVDMDIHSLQGQPQVSLAQEQKTKHVEVELLDTRRQVKHLKKLCRAQNREAQATERLVQKLLETARHQYSLLRAHQLVSPELEWQHQGLLQLVQEDRDVAWADQNLAEGQPPASDFDQLLELPVLKCLAVKTPANTPATRHYSARRTSRSSSARRRSKRGHEKQAGASPLLKPLPHTDPTPAVAASSSDTSIISTGSLELTSANLLAAGHTPFGKGNQPCSPVTDQALILQKCNDTQVLNQTGCGPLEASQTHSSAIARPNLSARNSQPSAHQVNLNATFQAETPNIELPIIDSPEKLTSVRNENFHMLSSNQQGVTKHSSHVLDSTFVIEKPTNITTSRPVVEKQNQSSKSLQEVNSTINNVFNAVKNRQQTHLSQEEDKENVPFEKGPKKKKIVRSMDFSGMPCPSPAGSRTFAEVVQSPGIAEQMRSIPLETRSPLTPRENIPPSSRPRGRDENLKKVIFKMPKDGENWPVRGRSSGLRRHNSEASGLTDILQKHGIPSMVAGQPSYMQPTKAVLHRNQGTRHGSKSPERRMSLAVSRVKTQDIRHNRRPARTLSQGKGFGWIKKTAIL